MRLPAARSYYLPENLHIEHCRKMGDLFSLTLRLIVYIPNPHAAGEARQVNREKEGEEDRKRGGLLEKKNTPHDKSLSSCKSHIK